MIVWAPVIILRIYRRIGLPIIFLLTRSNNWHHIDTMHHAYSRLRLLPDFLFLIFNKLPLPHLQYAELVLRYFLTSKLHDIQLSTGIHLLITMKPSLEFNEGIVRPSLLFLNRITMILIRMQRY